MCLRDGVITLRRSTPSFRRPLGRTGTTSRIGPLVATAFPADLTVNVLQALSSQLLPFTSVFDNACNSACRPARGVAVAAVTTTRSFRKSIMIQAKIDGEKQETHRSLVAQVIRIPQWLQTMFRILARCWYLEKVNARGKDTTTEMPSITFDLTCETRGLLLLGYSDRCPSLGG